MRSAFYGGCERDTARVRCCAPCCGGAVAAGTPCSNPLILPARGTPSSKPAVRCFSGRQMGQTDRRTDRHCTVTQILPHTMRALSIIVKFSVMRANWPSLLRPYRGADYCDERVCVCVCPRSYLRNYTKFSVHVTYGRCSILLWRRSDMLCTFGFVDDVMFAHEPRLLDVATQLKRSAHAA